MRFTVVGRWLAAVLAVLALACITVPSVEAQTTVGSIRGYITNGAGAPIGDVQVAARHLETNRVRGTISQASGFYFLGGLEPGRYELTVRRIGLAEQTRNVQLLIGQTLDLNFRMTEAATTLAGVDVIAQQGVETRTSEVATNVTTEQIDELPKSDRNFLNLAALAPGVTVQNDQLNAIRRTISAGAQGPEQINVFIDGASYKNDILKGGVAGQDASRGNPFPLNAVQEFRVLTQNYKAEYQKASSAIITAKTKSGGSVWEGSAFYNTLLNRWVALDTFQRRDRANNPNFQKPEFKREQFGFSAGGPITERLRFFGSYERNDQDRAARVSITPPSGFPALDTVDFASRNGEFASPFKADLGFAKLSFDHTPTSLFELSYNHRHESDIRNFGGNTSYEAATSFKNDVNTAILKHTLSRNFWLNEATVSFQRYRYNPKPLFDEPINRFYGFGCCAEIGANISTQDFTQKRLALRNDVTYSGARFAGEHVLKAGASLDFLNYDVIKRNSETPRFVYESWWFGFAFPQRVEFQLGDPNFSDKNTQIGLFLQDDWSPSRRLTINLGLRWDYESAMINTDYATPRSIVDSLTKYSDSLFVTLDPDRYFTDGSQRSPFYGAFQPRLGISYALDDAGRTTLFGGWGIFYDRTVYDFTLEERFAIQHPSYRIEFSDPNGPAEPGKVMWDNAYLQGLSTLLPLLSNAQTNRPEVKLLPNDLKPPSSQQFSAGIRQLFGTFAVEAAYTGVRSDNVPTFYWANQNFTCPARTWSCFQSHQVPGFGNILYADDRGKTWYDALQVKVDRRYQPGDILGWGGGLAYTLAKRETQGFNDDFSFPTAADYPKRARNDERHRVVMNWVVDSKYAWGISFSGLITLGSGAPYSLGGQFDGNFEPTGGKPEKHSFIIPNAWAYRLVDLRLRKDFFNYRGSALAVTFDVFNALNYQNLGCFNNTPDRNDVNFGAATCVVSDPRRFQLGFTYDLGRRTVTPTGDQ